MDLYNNWTYSCFWIKCLKGLAQPYQAGPPISLVVQQATGPWALAFLLTLIRIHLFIIKNELIGTMELTAATERPKSSIIPDSAGDENPDCKAIMI